MSRASFLGIFFAIISIQTGNAHERNFALVARDGLVLSGVLHEVKDARAVALILQGSGNVGLDGDVSTPYIGSGYRGLKPALSVQMAAHLAEMGISSYRFAKRGVENAEEQLHQNFPYLLEDARAALTLVRTWAVGQKVILVGHSEGALLATHLATQENVDALFLLSVPSRAIDSIFEYQFSTWPQRVLKGMDADQSGILESAEFAQLSAIPASGGLRLNMADLNKDGSLDLAAEVGPFFSAFLPQVFGLIDSMPVMAAWRRAMQALPALAVTAAQVTVPVYVYHGALDPQVPVEWSTQDAQAFPALREVRIVPGVGHAFSPFEGVYGEVKTSGPYGEEFLQTMKLDVLSFLGEK